MSRWRWHVALMANLLWATMVFTQQQEYNRTIYVDPERGSNNESCLTNSSPDNACRNLSYVFQLQYRQSSTLYLLLPGIHYLNDTASKQPFTSLSDLAITGNETNGSVEVACVTNASLAFVNVVNVTISDVSFSGCASQQNSTSWSDVFSADDHILAFVHVGLYFSHCESVSMTNVNVRNANATGVVVYNTIGANFFVDCDFTENVNYDPEVRGGGGGFYVEFSYCIPGDVNCWNGTEDSYTDHNQNSSYTFRNCTFHKNHATNKNPRGKTTFMFPHRQIHDAFGRGGGLSFFFKANATRNMVEVTDCLFSENTALWGGGLLVEFEDTSSENAFIVTNSTFERNHLLDGVQTAGGGLRLGMFVFRDGVTEKGNSIVVESCNFSSNSAMCGGGLSFSPAGQVTSGELPHFSLTNCTFSNNTASLGLAIHLMRFELTEGTVPRILITNLRLLNNTFINISDPTKAYEIRGGGLYTNRVGVDFVESATFCGNEASALIISAIDASFQNCTGLFVANEGLKGGAMLLLGSSYFTVNESTNMTFIGNTALWGGGAIYKVYGDRDYMAGDPNCFVRHKNPFLDPDDWGSVFWFYNNTDHNGKIDIHATTLFPCVWAGGMTARDVKDVFCWKNWSYNNKTNDRKICRKHLSSFAGNITYNYSVEAFSGLEVKLPIHTEDDFGRTRNVPFQAFSHNTTTAQIDSAFQYVAGNIIKFTGREGESFILELDTTTQRVWHLEMNITILPCPPGYTPTNTTSNGSGCSCNSDSYRGAIICTLESYNASLIRSHWMGRLGNETLVGSCPPKFCLTELHKKFISLPQNFSMLDDHICGVQNRTGILCGECKEGFGPAVNVRSDQFICVWCKNVNLPLRITKYILLEYLPLFLLFLALIVFKIKLTTGSANAFILFSQIVSSTIDITASGEIPTDISIVNPQYLILAYELPYGVFNLRFFEQLANPFCLSSGFNVLSVIALDYLVGLFPLLMILMIVIYVKIEGQCRGRRRLPCSSTWYRRVFHGTGSSIIPSFTSFLLLSYSKFILTSSYLVKQQTLVSEDGDILATRVYYAGHYSITDKHYIFQYRLPALFVIMLLGSLPPLLLLHYPLLWFETVLGKVGWLKRHYPSTKVHIFLDAFQGCFQPNRRFFAGLYFLFRLILYLSFTLSQTRIQHYTTQTIVCIVFAFLVTLFRPYTEKNWLFNYVDAAMFANLAVITVLGFYMLSVTHINPVDNPPPFAFWFQYILIFFPFFLMLGYFVWTFVIPRTYLYCHRLAGNIRHHDSSDVIDSSFFSSSEQVGGGGGGGTSGTWNIISGGSMRQSRRGSRRRPRHSQYRGIEDSVDWQRATLQNTYCRSPQPHDHLDATGRSEEEEEEEAAECSSRGISSSENERSLILSPTTSSAVYVTAPYGTIGGTTNTTDTTGTTTDEGDRTLETERQPLTTHNDSN